MQPPVIVVALMESPSSPGSPAPWRGVAWAIVKVWDNPDADISRRKRGSVAATRPARAGPVAPV